MFKNILIPTDGSVVSRRAIKAGIKLAQSLGAKVTGYYGMNVPYPGSGEQWGVAVSGALVVVMSSGLYMLFRKRDWL